jgi:amino acid transporter
MGKAFGVIGGFFVGIFVMTCVIIIMTLVVLFMLPSNMSSESMTGNNKSNGVSLALIGFGYLAGYIASIYFGYGFSYDTGYEDCKKDE